MKEFNVLIFDINQRKVIAYNVIPYFIREYNNIKSKPKTFDEFKEFIEHESLYQFWSKCEYEIIISEWPPCEKDNKEEKWDVHMQILMNIDIITEVLIYNIENYENRSSK